MENVLFESLTLPLTLASPGAVAVTVYRFPAKVGDGIAIRPDELTVPVKVTKPEDDDDSTFMSSNKLVQENNTKTAEKRTAAIIMSLEILRTLLRTFISTLLRPLSHILSYCSTVNTCFQHLLTCVLILSKFNAWFGFL